MANRQQSNIPPGSAGRELAKILAPGETVLDSASGKGGILLVATDRRAIIVKGIMGTGSWTGREAHSYGYGHITSVEIRTGFMDGYVEIAAGGVQQHKRGRMGQMRADNMVPYNKWSEGAIRRVVGVIQQQMYSGGTSQPQHAATPAPAAPDIPQQIAALAQLRDQGILSAAEFEAKKAELLRRM